MRIMSMEAESYGHGKAHQESGAMRCHAGLCRAGAMMCIVYAVLCGAMRGYAVLCGPVKIHAPLLPAMLCSVGDVMFKSY